MKILFAIIALSLISFSSCSVIGDNDPRTSLQLSIQHHERTLAGVEVYVKFFTTEFPGYDVEEDSDTILVSDLNGQVQLRDFPLGHHWFVGIGYDEVIREQVIGNLDLRFDLTHLRYDTILYVSEEH